MSKDQPLIFWTSFGVISVIAIGLLGWGAAGIAQFTTVQANQAALTQRVESVEKNQAILSAIQMDMAVVKARVERIEDKLDKKR